MLCACHLLRSALAGRQVEAAKYEKEKEEEEAVKRWRNPIEFAAIIGHLFQRRSRRQAAAADNNSLNQVD